MISLEDASLTKKGIVKLSSATDSDSEALAATPKAVKTVMGEVRTKAPLDSPAFTGTPTTPTPPGDAKGLQTTNAEFFRKLIAALVGSVLEPLDTLQELADALGNDPNFATTVLNKLAGKQPLDETLTALSGKSVDGLIEYVGLVDVLFKGDGRFLAGTFVSDAIDRTSIGARATTGCQFMRAHQAPDAPDQVSFWQIITLSEVVSPTTVVDVLAVSGNNVLFGHGTGTGITSWRQVAMLEGGAFTGGISAPNMRGDTLVTVGDGTGGMAKGDVDGAGFNGNNLNIKSWNGIGFQNSEDLAIRAYISTRLGVIAAAENLQAGSAIFNKNGDVYGDIWGGGSGPGWLSAFVASKPARQYITMVGVYQNDKTKPFMLHDDGSGVFLATTDMLSGYVQSIRFGAVEHGNLYRSPGFADQLGYVITGVENGDSNDTPDRIQRRLLQLKVNGQWYTVGA
ncbi:tail fiber protein [Salmonella enterica]|nr:tail fiber protein [Salmonella enterica]EIW2833547.1 tail fiber protein [Salmonella enterica]EIW3628027.1 tail fiber protein [Salmonella enterica]